MELLSRALALAPDDPFLLAGAVLLAWLPFCALGLAGLALLAAAQRRIRWPRAPRAAVYFPPEQTRPLAARRVSSKSPRRFGLLTAARLAIAIAAIAGLSALFLASTSSVLFAAWRS